MMFTESNTVEQMILDAVARRGAAHFERAPDTHSDFWRVAGE